jgi:heat-inducible transcriptional repressor
MSEQPGERQALILRAIVREHIRTAEPVGSKHLVGQYSLEVSPATVRNDMALLEEMGFLVQPHTSAGRVPTDLGYRYFVDAEPAARLGKPSERRLSEEISAEPTDLESLLRRASDVLSRFTHYAAAVLAPRLQSSRLKHLDLSRLGPKLVVVVLIAEGGRVEKRTIELEREIRETEVEEAAADLNRRLSGERLDGAHRIVTTMAGSVSEPNSALLRGVAAAIGALLEADQRVIVGGTSNLAGEDIEGGGLRRIYEAVERGTDLQRVLADATPPVDVRIGSEMPVEDLRSWSVVVAPYAPEAAVGVIGPKRMDYLRAIASVSLVARILEGTLRDLTG